MLDLLIINGHVIDPANGVDEVRPVAVYNGKIAHYEEGEPARHVIDAAGRYVFPGLIDSHAHMFAEGTDIGIYPDLAYLPNRRYQRGRRDRRCFKLPDVQKIHHRAEQGYD